MRLISLILYNILLPIFTVGMLPSAFIKMRRRGGRLLDLAQRFALWPTKTRTAIQALGEGHRVAWVHAVSVGEVGVAKKLIECLLKHSPDLRVLLTASTPTGLEMAREAEAIHPGRVVCVYSPWDLPLIVGRFLRKVRPWKVILVEAEVWPNMMFCAHRRGIPVALVNARLSGRSERRFQTFRSLISPIFALLTEVQVQEPEDVVRWERLGIAKERIQLTGSIKYDPQGSAPKAAQVDELSALLCDVGISGRPILLAASTHAGEERALSVVYLQLLESLPTLAFIIVPRHFERGAAVVAELGELGLKAVRRSQLNLGDSCDVLVADTTGELKAWQQLADVVIIGKSFLAHGGQNPAEAVLAEKPVVCGPNMENFQPLMKLLLAARGVIQLEGLDEIAPTVLRLLKNPMEAKELAGRGSQALNRHQGATLRSAELLCKDLPG